MPNFKKVRAGDKYNIPSASDYNAVMDMARQHYGREKTMGGGAAGLPTPSSIAVWVLNQSDKDIDVGEVLILSGVTTTPSDDLDQFLFNTTFIGKVVDYSPTPNPFGVAVEPIAKDATGRMVIQGIVPAKVYVNNSYDVSCGLWNGETVLQSGMGTSQIVYQDQFAQAGVQWCAVFIGLKASTNWCFATLIDTVYPNGSGAAKKISADNSNHRFTVYASPLLNSNSYYVKGSNVRVEFQPEDGKWYITDVQCASC